VDYCINLIDRLFLTGGERPMPDEPSTFGLNRDKLGKLWEMGEERPRDEKEADTRTRKAELLQDQLAESLPLNAGMQHLLPKVFTAVCRKLKPFTGNSFKELIMDPRTDPLILETIKDFHKKQAESATSDLNQEIAAIIYYLAIASALVYHDTRITKFPYKELARTFAELNESNWLLPDIKNLFGQAYNLCIQRLRE
jgi:hypothetical protein